MTVAISAFIGVAAASAVLVAVPGPAVLFIVGRALSVGRAAALATVLGNCAGSYAAAVVVAVGLGNVLQRSDLLLEIIRILGAAFLVWLGISAIRRPHTGDTATATTVGSGFSIRAIRTGFLVGISNPKSFIVFAVLIPPFISTPAGNVPFQMLLLSLVPVAIGAMTDSSWALGASAARGWFATSATRLTTIQRLGGGAIILLGLVTALSGLSG